MRTLWSWLMNGSDELTMPEDWLANQARIRQYTAYTMRQLQQGSIVSDVETMRRRAFWEHHAAKRPQTPGRVAQFGGRR